MGLPHPRRPSSLVDGEPTYPRCNPVGPITFIGRQGADLSTPADPTPLACGEPLLLGLPHPRRPSPLVDGEPIYPEMQPCRPHPPSLAGREPISAPPQAQLHWIAGSRPTPRPPSSEDRAASANPAPPHHRTAPLSDWARRPAKLPCGPPLQTRRHLLPTCHAPQRVCAQSWRQAS